MPGMAGTEYLVQARRLVPSAKRVLLTAYADTEAAIQAINEVALDFYLLKPWDPPEEQLFPVVEDLLTAWEAGAALESGGVRVVGHRFSKRTHDLRDFLARNRVPARWLDVERDGEARELLRSPGWGGRPARRAARGRDRARAADRARAGRAPRRGGPALGRPLRPRHRRRRPGRPGGRGVRGVGGPADAHGRARGARRPGRAVQPHRELPRLPDRAERVGPGPARDRPGPPARRRAADDPGRDRAARRGRRAARRASGGGVLRPTPCSSPPASPTASSPRPGSRTSPAPASTTAPR